MSISGSKLIDGAINTLTALVTIGGIAERQSTYSNAVRDSAYRCRLYKQVSMNGGHNSLANADSVVHFFEAKKRFLQNEQGFLGRYTKADAIRESALAMTNEYIETLTCEKDEIAQ